jgi:hypothetical protein
MKEFQLRIFSIFRNEGILTYQKLTLTSPTSGGRSVGIARSRTQAMEFSLVLVFNIFRNEGISTRSIHHISQWRNFNQEYSTYFSMKEFQPRVFNIFRNEGISTKSIQHISQWRNFNQEYPIYLLQRLKQLTETNMRTVSWHYSRMYISWNAFFPASRTQINCHVYISEIWMCKSKSKKENPTITLQCWKFISRFQSIQAVRCGHQCKAKVTADSYIHKIKLVGQHSVLTSNNKFHWNPSNS